MRNRLPFSCLLFGGLVLQAPATQAAISCSLSSPSWTSTYQTTVTTNTTGVGNITVTCTRALADPTTQTYTLAATNGLTPAGNINQATFGANKIKYNEFQDAALATPWGPTPPNKNAIAGTINFGTGTVASVTHPYYFSITALQAVAAGNYSDTVTATLTYGGVTAMTTHAVMIIVNPTCTISTAPGALSFAYSTLQPAAATASTSFALTCTNLTPYSAALDLYTATDTTTNITYTLNIGQTIKPAGAVYTPGAALTATGSGAAQTISIDGTIASGQAGTCATASCVGTTTRLLTFTY